MPGGGQLPLVAYGNQNSIVSGGNPEMTNFYKVFKRYTHFSQESITIPIDGPNEMMMDSPIRIRAKIPRHADLMTDLTFVFRIPEIYSKVINTPGETPPQYIPAFRWIHMLGAMIIDTVAIYVGGSKIQEFPGEWIAARAAADMPAEKYQKWRELVGDVPELHSPEWGVFGKSANYPYQKGEYPNVVFNDDQTGSAPSIPGRTIRVPLPFWFSEDSGRALPLVALQAHEVEVQITLRTLREIYRVMDSTFQRDPIRVGRTTDLDTTQPTSYDPTNPTAYDNLTLQEKYEGAAPTDVSFANGALRYFYTDEGQAIPLQDGFIMDFRLEGTYAYLTDREQRMFAERELSSLVHQVQLFRFPEITTRTKLDLDSHNLVHRILFYGRRSDAIEERNDFINLTNWKYANQAPYVPLSPGSMVPNSGQLIQFAQRDILRSARLLCAGNEVFEEKQAGYYELQNPFYTSKGAAGAHGFVKADDTMGPIYHLPFSLNSSDHFQPSGTLNTSRLREIQLEVQPWELDPTSPYAYDFTVFVESLNVVKYLNGMAGLAFAI
jgi:hypothetical protein